MGLHLNITSESSWKELELVMLTGVVMNAFHRGFLVLYFTEERIYSEGDMLSVEEVQV